MIMSGQLPLVLMGRCWQVAVMTRRFGYGVSAQVNAKELFRDIQIGYYQLPLVWMVRRW